MSADFNCDGFDDLAIGVPAENVANGSASNLDAGAVNVIYGSGDRLNASSTPNRVWTQQDLEGGASTGDRFGSAVAAGDFNGDGCDDLAVGVPGENIPFNGATVLDAGAVNVIKGSPTGLTAAGNTLWTQDPLAGAPEPGDQFGSSLTVGRLNIGGYDDLAVGVPGENDGAGAVNVVFGANAGLTASGNTVRAQGLQGPETAEHGDAFGKALATGDFDQDGHDDLAIGVPGENEELNTTIVNSGAVNVIYGSTFTLSTTRFGIWRQIHDNWETDDRYGSALAVGDFDDDGYADLAVGAPGENDDSGAVSVLYGKWSDGLDDDDAQFWTQDSPSIDNGGVSEAGDLFGSSLAVGDFNPGGKDDLAIGVPGEDLKTGTSSADGGAVNVLYGANNGVNQAGEQLWTQDTTSLAGDDAQTSDAFGSSLSTGDFNGDNNEDLAVGVPGEDVVSGSGTTTNAGAVNVIYGAFGLTVNGNQFWSQAPLAGSLGGGDGFGAALPT